MDDIGWKVRGDFQPAENRRNFFPRLKHVFGFIKVVLRFCVFRIKEWWHGRGVFIDIFKPMHHDKYTGMPIGGIGCGSIGTDFRGGFNSFSLVPGIKEKNIGNIKGNQFILTVFSNDGARLLYHRCLTGATSMSGGLKSWKLEFPKENIRYRGLFPRSWTTFLIPELGLELECETMSPVIPQNYEDSSLPVCNFNWKVKNNSTEDYRISLTFTFRNGTGDKQHQAESMCTQRQVCNMSSLGVELHHQIRKMPVIFGIYTNQKHDVTMSSFRPDGNGKTLWKQLEESGCVTSETNVDMVHQMGIAMCQMDTVSSNSQEQFEFSLVWHMPIVHFGAAKRSYKRRYTRFFGVKDEAAFAIGQRSLEKREQWKDEIEKWQKPVIDDDSLPEWYKSALFNELYFIVDGAVVWLEYDEEWPKAEPKMSPETIEHYREYGRFAYMESWEYKMFNTYDVHFYASFALLYNWPQLELSMQLDFSDQVFTTDTRKDISLQEGHVMQYKRSGRLPHDMGHPAGDPFVEVNAYILHDTGDWKDLNLKYVLLSWRDYKHIVTKTMDKEKARHLLSFFYLRSKEIIDRGLREWDSDGDGLIENDGFPDQTYDVWLMTGTSSYCGSLWLAAMLAVIRMAEELNEKEDINRYRTILDGAKQSFVDKLWNGSYFDFDEQSSNRKTIMADQLCGFWFLSMTDGEVNEEIIGKKMLETAMNTIFDFNVQKFKGGEMGAVNGLKPNGELDLCSIQSEEVWTGTTYALASFYLLNNDKSRGFDTARGIYESCWNRFGLQYQTPEALFEENYYRAIGYMRPLAIWAMQGALETRRV